MNRIIPYRSPFCTGGVWCPWKVPSRTTSRHHWYIVRRVKISPSVIRVIEWKWNQIAVPEVSSRAPTAPVSGQGLGSTMWNACAWWAIRRFLVGKGLKEEQRHMLESSLRLLLAR